MFVLWKFKYVIWKGWFRAIIICEDGDILIRTFRLKTSDTEFTATIKGKVDTYQIVDNEARDEIAAKQDKVNETPNPNYNPTNRRIYRIGRFRIPTSFYNAHQTEPIDMQNLRKYSVVSATRYRELAKNTVTSQLLTAFTENPMKEALMIFLGVVIILGGMLIMGYWFNTKIEEVLNKLG